MFCSGCNKTHDDVQWIGKGHETKWYCHKFASPPKGINYDNFSPQEIVSGVHLGMPRQEVWGPDTEDHSVVHAKQVQALGESLEK